ncbi:MAG: THUMP domain-containing protein, partial [Bdellovibrionales bacterium]|nr:THUMP domain-containing protein [Bdellovibrionales bacterium]
EKQAVREVEEILQGKELHPTVGGVQFNSTWGAVRLGQSKLKTASRVVVRVDQFGARDFQKLFRKVSGLPWSSWLKSGTKLAVRASSHGSRLRIKKGIERTVTDAFQKTFKPSVSKLDVKSDLLCLVRLEDDLCTISLDMSGELLHKRGDREDVGRAPLRETWAAAILAKAADHVRDDQELAKDFSSPWHWIEPMAGTAVFLREAFKSQGALEGAVASREFAVDKVFKFKSPGESSAVAIGTKSSLAQWMERCQSAWVIDQDPAQLARAEAGLKQLASKTEVSFHLKPPPSLDAEAVPESKKFVILNPPWGVRLKGIGAVNTLEAQASLLMMLNESYHPKFTVVLLPDTQEGGKSLKVPNGWTELEGFSFRAGGIPVTARFFKVRSR